MLEVASQMASAMDCYEDMFKEITRKLYGEEEDVDFEAEGFKSVEHLTAAFGLATRSHLKSETPAAQQPKPSPTSEQESPNPPQVNTPTATKRYNCTHCPYATDRRDLFTRHENIHREDKPFQCYVCMKQFNRADHVKKHFLRMHREHTYDLNRIRKQPPKNASGMSFYHKYNESQPLSNNIQQSVQNHQQQINIPSGIVNPNVRNNQTPIEAPKQQPKTNSNSPNKSSSSSKKKGEKKFSCCYCTWTGVDNWCLKRHLNTHLKPFVCMLCDYKAARSERLTTHILKVHNKRACTRCNFLADDQAALTIHLQENHPLDHRNNRNVHNRNNQNNNTSTNTANTTAATMSSAFGYDHKNVAHSDLPQIVRDLDSSLPEITIKKVTSEPSDVSEYDYFSMLRLKRKSRFEQGSAYADGSARDPPSKYARDGNDVDSDDCSGVEPTIKKYVVPIMSQILIKR